MQTFMTYSDPVLTANYLDRQRLGKQRVEVLQLLNANLGLSKGWVNHPAARMWKGHEGSLARYGLAMCEVWVERGYKDSCADKIRGLVVPDENWPEWYGRDDILLSHRSNLVRKNPEFYGRIWPDVPNNLPYVWPVQ